MDPSLPDHPRPISVDARQPHRADNVPAAPFACDYFFADFLGFSMICPSSGSPYS
jgi:hypothetical protein